jgi:hypothetical protein
MTLRRIELWRIDEHNSRARAAQHQPDFMRVIAGSAYGLRRERVIG